MTSKPDCIFCKIVEGKIPCRNVGESTNFLAFLDIAPNAAGHSLIIPKKHATSLLDLPESLGNELVEFSQRMSMAIMRATGSDGVNIVMNNGAAAGQVVFHMHVHIVPRKMNDGLHYTPGQQLHLSDEIFAKVQQDIAKHLQTQ